MHALDCQNGEIAEMIQTFSEIFRETVREGSFTDIADEFESCRTYTDLFLIKYGQTLDIDYIVEQEVYRYGIIRKVLQPILENYFIHGYDKNKSDNRITITAKMDFDDIVISVCDNGLGIAESKLHEIRESLKEIHLDSKTSIGISNVDDRIKLIYGNSYGVNIKSVLNQYTLVTIRVKAKTKSELEKYFLQLANANHL